MLHAATRATKKRKQRAATATASEELGEVPGVGVPLALVVILLLHVAAIAGIWLHDRWSDSADLEATRPALKEDVAPTRNKELAPYPVEKGDTLESIAQKHGVTPKALAGVNNGVSDFQAGWVINLPPRRSADLGAVTRIPNVESEIEVAPYAHTSRPLIQTRDDRSVPGSQPGELVEVGINEPIRVTPARPTQEARVVIPAPHSSSRTQIVKSGETLWRIAQNNNVTVNDLQQANPGVNASTLGIGTRLVIPASR